MSMISSSFDVRDFSKRHGGEQKKRFTEAEVAAFNKHGWRCVYCGSDGPLTADHVIPRASGGGDEAENLVPACRACNSSRRNTPQEEFMEHIQAMKVAYEMMFAVL